MRPFGEAQRKAMRAYAQSGQYHTIVESRVHLTWYQSHALNLALGNRILKYQTKIVSLEKVSNKGCTLFEGSRERS